MSDLKEKTINGIFWSAIDNFSNQGIQFIVGIFLARLLSPREFGLVGMIAIFIAVSQTFIDSGFSSSLIRKKECTQADYSTVFYYNLVVGLLLYLLLFFSADLISDFYTEPQLKWIIRIAGLDLIVRSFTIIQRTTLAKQVNYKLMAKITVISGIISGGLGITMALKGYGVWSLVARSISAATFSSFFLWIWNKWRPSLVFSLKSFKELFGFGSKLLASGLLDTVYSNIYLLIIGKFFSAKDLGYYTRAQIFSDLPSKNINGIMQRVTYPVLAQLQDDPTRLKAGYKKIIKNVMYLSFVIMMGIAAIAEPMIITLLGEAWRPSIIFLQMLCFVGMLYPLQALNLNILNVQGRSDLFLKLEIIKKLFAVPVIIAGVIWGIKVMIICMWINSLLAYYLNSYFSGKLIKYSILEQVKDIFPTFLLGLFIGSTVFFAGRVIPTSHLVKLLILVPLGAALLIIFSEIFRFDAYLEIKKIIQNRIISKINVKN